MSIFNPNTFFSLSAFSLCLISTSLVSFMSKASLMASTLMSSVRRPKLKKSPSGKIASRILRAILGISTLSVRNSVSKSAIASSSLTSMIAPFMSSKPLFTLRWATTSFSVSVIASLIFCPNAEISVSILPNSIASLAANFLANSKATSLVFETYKSSSVVL